MIKLNLGGYGIGRCELLKDVKVVQGEACEHSKIENGLQVYGNIVQVELPGGRGYVGICVDCLLELSGKLDGLREKEEERIAKIKEEEERDIVSEMIKAEAESIVAKLEAAEQKAKEEARAAKLARKYGGHI